MTAATGDVVIVRSINRAGTVVGEGVVRLLDGRRYVCDPDDLEVLPDVDAPA